MCVCVCACVCYPASGWCGLLLRCVEAVVCAVRSEAFAAAGQSVEDKVNALSLLTVIIYSHYLQSGQSKRCVCMAEGAKPPACSDLKWLFQLDVPVASLDLKDWCAEEEVF